MAVPESKIRQIAEQVDWAALQQQAQGLSWADRNLPARYHGADLAKASGPAAEACRQYVAQFLANSARGLYLFGPTGSGKTWLAAAVAKAVAALGQQYWPKWCEMHDVARALREEAAYEPGRSRPMQEKLRTDRLLVLDDLGAGRLTEFVAEQIEAAICYRYDHALPILVTTNMSLEELDDPSTGLGGRVTSRLAEMCQVVRVIGPDRRLQERGRLKWEKEG